MGRSSLKAGAAVGLGLGFAIKTGMKFDKTMSTVRAATSANKKQFDQLRKAALDWGAKSQFSATEVAEAQIELGKAGFKTAQILASLPGVLDAAAASGESMATVSSIMVDTLTGFGLAAGKATMVSDALAFSANETTGSITDFGEALKYVAPVAKSAGMSFHETNAALIALAKVGIKGSMAGTNLRGVIQSMVAPNKRVTEAMKAMGLSFRDSQGNMLPLATNIDRLKKVLDAMPKSKADAFLARMFGRENISAAQAFLDIGGAGLRNFTKQSEGSAGSAAKFAAVLRDNLSGDLEQLTGAAETAAIKMADDLTPALRDVAREATKLIDKFNELDPGTRKAITQFIAASAVFLTFAGVVGVVGGAVLRGVSIMARAFGPLWAVLKPLGKFAGRQLGMLASGFRSSAAAASRFSGPMGTLGGWLRQGLQLFTKLGAVVRFVAPAFEFVAAAVVAVAAAIGVSVGVLVAIIAAVVAAAVLIVVYWDKVKAGTVAAWNAVVNAVKVAASKVAGAVGAMVGKVQGWWQKLRSITMSQVAYAFGYVLGYIVGTLAKIIINVAKFAISLAGKLGSAAKTAGSMFVAGVRALPGVVASLVAAVIRWFSNMAQSVASLIGMAASRAASGAKAIASAIRSGIAALPGLVASTFQRVVSALWNAIKAAPGKVKAGLKAIPGIVKSIAGAAKSAAVSVGTAIIDGMVEGVKKAAGKLASAAKSAAKGALDGAKNALGIHSPSTVFRDEVGKPIAEGMAQGILNRAGFAKQAVADVTGSLVAVAKRGVDAYARATTSAEVAAVRLLGKTKAAGAALASAYRTAKGELARLTLESGAMEKSIAKQQKTIDDLGESLNKLSGIQLGGTQAFSDASFAKEQEQNAAALKMVQLRLQGLTDEDQPIIDLQAAMDKLGLEAEALQLQEKLQLDPLRRQWEQTINPIRELDFASAVAQWSSLQTQQAAAQGQLESMTGTYDALTASIEKMTAALQATLEAGQAAQQAKEAASGVAQKRANLQRQIDNAALQLKAYEKKGQGQSVAAKKLRNNIAAWKAQLAKLPAAANGAILTRPSVIQAGEMNRPEAIIPLDRIGEFLPGGAGDAQGGVTVIIQGGNFRSPNEARALLKEAVKELRLQGVTVGR
ncbi:MAG TPA: phage tail tape measure protein [Agromyces sp.]